MRKDYGPTMLQAWLVIVLTMLANAPAFAQSTPGQRATKQVGQEKPIDTGPFTPAANNAYQGGGMILQGAPGAPAPKPTATEPGQTPANIVPLK